MDNQTLEHRTTGPRFSVIIPAFNRERFIRETIQSILDQRYAAHEIIVVDDGSTDGTGEVVRNFSSPFLRYVYQDNQGPAVARNKGASLANGDWLAFLDADDIWRSEKLFVQAEYVRNRPQPAMFWCDFDCIDEAGRLRKPVNRKDPLAPLLFHSLAFPLPSTVILRKDAFDAAAGFNPAWRCYEDLELFVRIAAQFPTHFIHESLIRYRVHRKQLHRDVRSMAAGWPPMYELLLKLFHGDPDKLKALTEIAACTHAYLGKHFLRGGELREARRHFRLSFEQKPLSWANLRRWGLSYLPPARELYRRSKKHAARL